MLQLRYLCNGASKQGRECGGGITTTGSTTDCNLSWCHATEWRKKMRLAAAWLGKKRLGNTLPRWVLIIAWPCLTIHYNFRSTAPHNPEAGGSKIGVSQLLLKKKINKNERGREVVAGKWKWSLPLCRQMYNIWMPKPFTYVQLLQDNKWMILSHTRSHIKAANLPGKQASNHQPANEHSARAKERWWL